MYLTDIRGFSAEDNITVCPLCDFNFTRADCAHPLGAAKGKPMCKITLHGMGFLGKKGLTLHFARFCRLYRIEPQFLSLSDMGISFFTAEAERERVLDALCEYFPMWT